MVGIVLNIELIISAAKIQQNSEKIVYLQPKISCKHNENWESHIHLSLLSMVTPPKHSTSK